MGPAVDPHRVQARVAEEQLGGRLGGGIALARHVEIAPNGGDDLAHVLAKRLDHGS